MADCKNTEPSVETPIMPSTDSNEENTKDDQLSKNELLNKIKNLEMQNDQYNCNIKQLISEKDKLYQQIDSNDDKYSLQSSKINKLEIINGEYKKEVELLNNDINTFKNDIKKLNNEIQNKSIGNNDEMIKLQNNLNEITKNNENMKIELTENDEIIDNLTLNSKTLRTQCETLNQSNKQKELENKQLLSEITHVKKLSTLEQIISDLQYKNNKLNEQNESNQILTNNKNNQINNITNKLNNINKGFMRLCVDNKGLNEKIVELNDSLKQNESDMKEKSDMIEKLESDVNMLNQLKQVQTDEIHKLNAKDLASTTRIVELENELEEWKDKYKQNENLIREKMNVIGNKEQSEADKDKIIT